MLPFERPIRDQVLEPFEVDLETFNALDERDYFTTALNRYVQRGNRERDMYRETLDDLVDALNGQRRFSRFPPKHRHENKYYTDHWRQGFPPPSRLLLYRLRKRILWELYFCGIVTLPNWPWQRILIRNPDNLLRLQSLIAEFEDRCLLDLHRQESRIEYDEVRCEIVEHSREEKRVLRTFKFGKTPQKLFECLFRHDGIELSVEQLYEKMDIPKKDRRFPRWRDEIGLDQPDMAKYFHWKTESVFVFSAKCFQSMGRNENTYQYPFVIPKPDNLEKVWGVARFKMKFLFMGVVIKPPDDLTKRPPRGFFAGLLPAWFKTRPQRPSGNSSASSRSTGV